jgi:hypothetical protein
VRDAIHLERIQKNLLDHSTLEAWMFPSIS